MQWCQRPVIYEINTFVWLYELSERHQRPVTLANVPAQEWDALGALRVDAVWFMGVWERSPASMRVSNANAAQQVEFQRALPDYQRVDNIGSAYSVRAYVVDARLGGAAGLAAARAELAARGLRLILDFVPNHVALDHAWVTEHPEYFVRGALDDLARAPQDFSAQGDNVIAHGRDPYFPPWRDVAQLNIFDAGLRAAALETTLTLAAQCDGVRCDMAMLMLNEIFARTWGDRAGAAPEAEYWRALIPAVKAQYPDFIFIAEAYWNREFELMQQGLDYCYDKRLYDRLAHENAASVREHLQAGVDYQDRLVRFIENHDEARAATAFTPWRARAAAVIVAALPGAKLLHDGQLDGRKIKLPVFLRRRAPETRNYELEVFYRALLKTTHDALFHAGTWEMCAAQGWSDNTSNQNILSWAWRNATRRMLIVVNYADRRSQGMVQVPWPDMNGRVWRLSDVLNGEVFLRDGAQLHQSGLFVDLDAWRFHFLEFE